MKSNIVIFDELSEDMKDKYMKWFALYDIPVSFFFRCTLYTIWLGGASKGWIVQGFDSNGKDRKRGISKSRNER